MKEVIYKQSNRRVIMIVIGGVFMVLLSFLFIYVLFKISAEKFWIYHTNYGILYMPNQT